MESADTARRHAVVVVLGDVGRSPRMCYHALSLASHGLDVELVGYLDTTPHSALACNPRIRLVPIRPPPPLLSQPRALLPGALLLLLKLLWLAAATLWALTFGASRRTSIILMQNPPGIPTMAICYVMARLKGAHLVIDWHNYTSAMLAAAGNGRGARFADWWEGYWGRRAKWSVCVSKAMQTDLRQRWAVSALTLYDKPPAWIFRPHSLEEKHAYLQRLAGHLEQSVDDFAAATATPEGATEPTAFSYRDADGQVRLREARPLLLVSTTSWTADEDFGILLDALGQYEKHAQLINAGSGQQTPLPRVLALITGKGPHKAHYLERIGRMRGMRHVRVATAWLPAEDYPRLLASADLGVCLHTSTSGLDLPMKVVDMYGCHLPVLAKRFKAIGELVNDPTTGVLFDTPTELKQALVDLATGFPAHGRKLDAIRRAVKQEATAGWEQQWDAVLWPLLQQQQQRRGSASGDAHEQRRWERFQQQ